MDDEALVWFQDTSEAGNLRSWEKLAQVVELRFGSTPYDDPMEALTRLKQVTRVPAYKSEFEYLSSRIKGISKRNKLSYFLSDLKDKIRLHVRMLKPNSLIDALGWKKFKNNICGVVGELGEIVVMWDDKANR